MSECDTVSNRVDVSRMARQMVSVLSNAPCFGFLLAQGHLAGGSEVKREGHKMHAVPNTTGPVVQVHSGGGVGGVSLAAGL